MMTMLTNSTLDKILLHFGAVLSHVSLILVTYCIHTKYFMRSTFSPILRLYLVNEKGIPGKTTFISSLLRGNCRIVAA